MKTKTITALAAFLAATAFVGSAAAQNGELRCPAKDCPGEVVVATGSVVDPKTGRKFFLDYPKDIKPGEKLVFVLNLHGGGSFGNWQRHYFPIVDQVEKYRLIVATPNAPPRVWAATDDAHLQNVVDLVYEKFGRDNIKALWLAGHSQGGMTSRRIVCSDYFAPKVTGFLSLSGGRIGGQPERTGRGPAPQRGETAPSGPTPEVMAAMAKTMATPVACDFSHIYATGEHEVTALPEASDWATKYNCAPRVRRADIVDTQAGYIYDTSRQDPPTKAWGRPAAPGVTQIYVYPNCKDGRVVADLMRVDKGHTEGLEPQVVEEIVKLMISAK